MRKLVLSLVAAIVASTAMYAQSSFVATLNHNDTVSVFYGANAFSEALSSAQSGDEISLSAGLFNAANITKAVTIRGAGFEEDTIRMVFPTVISGDFNINASPTGSISNVGIEGVWFKGAVETLGTLRNVTFAKSRLSSFRGDYISSSSSYTSKIYNLTFANCIVERLDMADYVSVAQINCINSFIGCPWNVKNSNHWMEFTNCVVASNTISGNIFNSIFHNCILIPKGGTFILDSSNLAYHCVGYSSDKDNSIFANIEANYSNESNPDLAKGVNASMFKPNTYYELTNEAKNQYVGGDGTEVGLYGGNLPFSSRVLAPQIVKCDVDKKTSVDGKLSIDIEVEAVE